VRLGEPQLEPVSTPTTPGVIVRRNWQKHLLTFLMVFGPGLIVMEADNDAGDDVDAQLSCVGFGRCSSFDSL